MNKKHTKIILLARLDLSHARATSAMFDARLSNLHSRLLRSFALMRKDSIAVNLLEKYKGSDKLILMQLRKTD